MFNYLKCCGIFLLILAIWYLYNANSKRERKLFQTSSFRWKKMDMSTPDTVLQKGNGIIFIEITDRMNVPPLVLCSLESAARVYPRRPVAFFMQGLPKMKTADYQTEIRKKFPTLSSFQNIYFFPLRIYELFTSTPLFNWYTKVNLTMEKYWIHVMADGCRLAFIWKYGGLYFDADIISMRPVPHKNFLVAESEILCANSVFGFTQYHGFTWISMENFVKNYKGEIWGHQGPLLFTRVMKTFCEEPKFNFTADGNCRFIPYLNPQRFFPILYKSWKKYFEVYETLPTFNNSYSLHLWNYMNKNNEKSVLAGSNTLVDHIFKQYCPTTHAFMLNNSLLYT